MNIKIIDCPFFQGLTASTPKMQFFRAGTAQTIDLWQCILARANLRRFFTTLKNNGQLTKWNGYDKNLKQK